MPQPEFLSSIDSKMGLETPQIVVSWEFGSPVSPFSSGVPWEWVTAYLRRDSYRYPEDVSEGTSKLAESYSTNPTTSVADITVTEDTINYYSLFFKYNEVDSSLRTVNQDISRLFTNVATVEAVTPELKVSGTDLATNSNTIVTSVGSTFQTDGINAGDLLLIAGGADAGVHVIASVDLETQLTLTVALTATAGSITFYVLSDELRWAMGGSTFERKEKVFIYNEESQMVDSEYDLTPILGSMEKIEAIISFNDFVATPTLQLVTSTRYLSLALPSVGSAITTLNISNEWDLNTRLSGGYKVVGGSLYSGYLGGTVSPSEIAILDGINGEIKFFIEATGVTSSTTDLSGLENISYLNGLSFDEVGNGATVAYAMVGNLNYIYSFDATNAAPDDSDVVELTYLRDQIDAGFAWDKARYTYFGEADSLAVVNRVGSKLEVYTKEVGRGVLWQQPFIAEQNTIGLYHMDGVSPLNDSTQYANTAVNNGMVHQEDLGRFGDCYEADLAGSYLDISAISGEFDGAEGSALIWFKADTTSVLNSSTSYMLSLDVNASNYIRIGIVSGSLSFEYVAGATSKSVVAAHPSVDTGWHSYKITWSSSADEVKAYVDGTQFGTTQSTLGVWAGVLVTAVIGGATADTALGYYDECRLSDIPRTVRAPVEAYTDRNEAHEYSGIDPDNRSFNYRDEYFTEKFLGGDFMIRNDFQIESTPKNVAMPDDNEIIWRQDVQELGDLGRLSRLFGLFLDRVGDRRDRILTDMHDILNADVDAFEDMAYHLGIKDLDLTWNVDRQRKWIQFMRRVLREGGTQDSYHRLSKLLNFKLVLDTLQSRRYLDSVVDPLRPDVYLDQQGSLDTSDSKYPLSTLRFTWYKQEEYSTTGATSIPANRILTDAGIDFTDIAKAGSLIRINDLSSSGDNGDYLVASVLSATTILLDRDFTVGSLSNLSYSVNWEVPNYDPYNNYLLDKMNLIIPDVMKGTLL